MKGILNYEDICFTWDYNIYVELELEHTERNLWPIFLLYYIIYNIYTKIY